MRSSPVDAALDGAAEAFPGVFSDYRCVLDRPRSVVTSNWKSTAHTGSAESPVTAHHDSGDVVDGARALLVNRYRSS
jgi:hypothetical protein